MALTKILIRGIRIKTARKETYRNTQTKMVQPHSERH
jgi:hypothetical protein